MMPGARNELFGDLWHFVLLENFVDIMLLTPQQGGHDHLACFGNVEITRAQVTQYVLVGWHLDRKFDFFGNSHLPAMILHE